MTSQAHLMRYVSPRAYHDNYIREGFFDDHREVDTFRTMYFQMHVNQAPGIVGSSLVRAGGATVRAAVDAHISLTSTEPVLIIKVQASENISEETVEESQNVLNDLVKHECFFPRSSAATEDVRLEWRLEVTVEIMNEDGCVLDAVVGAVLAAFVDTKLPAVSLNIEPDADLPVHTDLVKLDEETRRPLVLNEFLPVACSFYITKTSDDKTWLLCDAPSDVKECMEGTSLTMIIGAGEEILRLSLKGEIEGDEEKQISTAVRLAVQRRNRLVEQLLKGRR